MLRFNGAGAPAVKALRSLLDRLRYDAVQKSMRGYQYFIDPWPNFLEFSKLLQYMPEDLQVCFELFMLGKPVALRDAERVVSSDLLESLASAGLLVLENNEAQTRNFCIISYLDHYFVTELPYFYPTCTRKNTKIYMGADSYWLAHNLLSSHHERVLDLCTGTGIQAILSSMSSSQSIGVDINEEAVNAARFNVCLNHLEDKLEIRQGNLYQAVEGEAFDLIYANPPFLPVPQGVEYPLAGDGGEDGLKILNEIIGGFHKHLKDGGQAVIIGEALGDRSVPFLVAQMETLCKREGWDALIVIRDELPLFFQANMIAQLTSQIYERDQEKAELANKWKELYKSLEAEYLYPFILFVRKEKGGKFSVIKPYQRWRASDRPLLAPHIRFEEVVTSYSIKDDSGKQVGEIDGETFDFLKLCSGSRRIEDIVAQLFPKYAHRYETQGVEKALNDALHVCDALERMGAIKKG